MISTADLADTRSRKTLRPIVLVLANRPELHSGSLAGSPTKCLANAGVIMACSSQCPAYERAGHWPLSGPWAGCATDLSEHGFIARPSAREGFALSGA
jgi:hypothetical protein